MLHQSLLFLLPKTFDCFKSYQRIQTPFQNEMCTISEGDILHALIKIRFWLLFSNIRPHQQVQSAPSSLPLLANPALLLENLTATTRMNLRMSAAAIVRTSQYPVSLTTRPLALDFGRCHHLLAPQTAVAARVSGVENVFRHASVSSTYPG